MWAAHDRASRGRDVTIVGVYHPHDRCRGRHITESHHVYTRLMCGSLTIGAVSGSAARLRVVMVNVFITLIAHVRHVCRRTLIVAVVIIDLRRCRCQHLSSSLSSLLILVIVIILVSNVVVIVVVIIIVTN